MTWIVGKQETRSDRGVRIRVISVHTRKPKAQDGATRHPFVVGADKEPPEVGQLLPLLAIKAHPSGSEAHWPVGPQLKGGNTPKARKDPRVQVYADEALCAELDAYRSGRTCEGKPMGRPQAMKELTWAALVAMS